MLKFKIKLFHDIQLFSSESQVYLTWKPTCLNAIPHQCIVMTKLSELSMIQIVHMCNRFTTAAVHYFVKLENHMEKIIIPLVFAAKISPICKNVCKLIIHFYKIQRCLLGNYYLLAKDLPIRLYIKCRFFVFQKTDCFICSGCIQKIHSKINVNKNQSWLPHSQTSYYTKTLFSVQKLL